MNPCPLLLSFAIYLVNPMLSLAQKQSLTFAPPKDVAAGQISGISALAVADFDQDGQVDVAVFEGGAHAGGRTTFAWLQKSNEVWQKHELELPDGADDFIGAAKAADIDSDGDMDLVWSNDGHSTGPIKIFTTLNPGRELVYQPWESKMIATIEGFHANDMRIVDLDQNGNLDVIIRHKGPEALTAILQVEHDLWTIREIHRGQAGEGLAVGDVNMDHRPDLTMTGHWFATPVDVLQDSFTRYDIDPDFKYVNKATKEDMGDLDGDGLLDLVLSPAEHFKKYGGDAHHLAWYRGPSDPEKKKAWKKTIIRSNYNKAHCVKLADFDNDGDLDVLSAIAWDEKEIRIYLNDNGNFERSLLIAKGKGIYSGEVADMDGDGDLDIVGEDGYSNTSRPYYYENLLINK